MRTIMLRRLAPVATALALLGLSSAALAQDAPTSPALALDRFNPAPAGDRMLGVQSPYVAGDLTPHFSILADYAHNPLVLKATGSNANLGAVVSDQLFMHLNATLAIKHRLLVNLELPIALLQAGASPSGGGLSFTSPSSAEVGDLRAGLRVRLLGDYWDPLQLAIGGYVWFPTGSSANGSFVGEGSVRGLPQVIVGGRVGERIVWAFDIGPDLRGSHVFGGASGVPQGTMVRFDGGLGFLLDDARTFQIGPEIQASFQVQNRNDIPVERTTNLEVMLGARYRVMHDFEAGIGVGPGITSGIGTPDLRLVGMVSYSPEMKKEAPPRDTDGDGILDPQDACVTLKGPANPDPKLHGCPDSDSDGIFDLQDACVTIKGLANADPKVNGCPDSDGDGIFDQQDACPNLKGAFSPDPKLNGCPDSDSDGIPDQHDACPTVKGVPNDDPTLNGCPPDKDADGVIDAEDACPEIKGLKTTDPTTNGCPGDTDHDTIRDDKDACPNEKGKPDPDPTKNGCPEAVRVTETEVIIFHQVQFDTAKATIKKVSDPLLDQVGDVIREHPEIVKLEVQGHTDSRGSPFINTKLSQDRAESVKKALVKRGINGDRLIAKGYGPDKPIGDNNTDDGRQKNRRVQFVIQEKTAKDKAPPPDPVPTTPATPATPDKKAAPATAPDKQPAPPPAPAPAPAPQP
jgi:OOP family OmpA-OmpF porin